MRSFAAQKDGASSRIDGPLCSSLKQNSTVLLTRANKTVSRLQYFKVPRDQHFKPLTAKQVEGVEKFVFFTGYPRSGHSIVGSLLDAHPNIILSYAFTLFNNLLKTTDSYFDGLLQNKTLFFNIIYEKSYAYSLRSSKMDSKNYTLDVPGLWSGSYDGRLKVIGDKSALPTTQGYSRSSPDYFKNRYDFLQCSVGIPLLGIHVVRNPFDMISTALLYYNFGPSWKNQRRFATFAYKNVGGLEEQIEFYFNKAKAVQEMVPLCGMDILEVHNEDMIRNPREELKRMCEFLGVECSEEYLVKCENKSYRTVSRTRDLVFWPPHLQKQVEEKISTYSFFKGYTFEEDYYNPA